MSASPPRRGHAQRTTVINAILVFVVLINVLQLWLLTATVSLYLGGATEIVLPAGAVSLGCLLLNLGLWRYLRRAG